MDLVERAALAAIAEAKRQDPDAWHDWRSEDEIEQDVARYGERDEWRIRSREAIDMRAIARAVLMAIREPGKDLLDAVKPRPEHWSKDDALSAAMDAAVKIDQLVLLSDWQAMLDTALTAPASSPTANTPQQSHS